MALVERIEILKGQSSVLYGSGSPGGTVNYISKQPQAENHNKISLALGNYDLARGVFDSTGSLNADKTLLYRFIGAGQLGDDFRANVSNNRATLAPSLQWRYADHGTLDLALEYSHETQPYRFDNVFTQGQVVYDHSYVDPRAQSDRAHWRVSMALSQQLLPDWSLHLSGQYFHVERDDLLFGFFTFTNPTTLSGYHRDVHNHYDQFSLRGELHGEIESPIGDHHLIVGIERTEMDDRLNSLRNIGGFTLDVYNPDFNHPPPTGTQLDRDLHSIEYGYYLTDRIDLNRYWHVSGGMRYSQFTAENSQNDVFGELTDQGAFTFNGGLAFTPTDWLTPYFGYSESFLPNEGTDRNRHFLPPKQGQQFEFGIKSRWFDRLNASAAVYRLTQKNLAQRDPTDPDFQVAAGEIQSQGLELELAGDLNDALHFIANYSWTKAEFTQHSTLQGNAFRSTPQHSGAVWLKYDLPQWQAQGHFDLGGGLVLVDQRQGDDANSFTVPGYIRADLSAGYRNGPFDVRLKIENLLDKRYVSASLFDDTVVQGNRLLVRGVVNFSFQ
ncbi:MAG: TonB-dependent receptor [Methyloglobulus sp.]|nr:TonB-dependent receptor [Methyloglobulus sp.]